MMNIEYYSWSKDEITEREVEPFTLVVSRGHWYLSAWCHLDEDYRLFRLDRIKKAVVTKKKVSAKREREHEVPDVVVATDRGKYEVQISFTGEERWTLVEQWQAANWIVNKDGSLTLKIKTDNLTWLVRYLLRFGDEAQVEKPEELKKQVKREAKLLSKLYDKYA